MVEVASSAGSVRGLTHARTSFVGRSGAVDQVAFISVHGTTWRPTGAIMAGVVAVAAAARPHGYVIAGKQIAVQDNRAAALGTQTRDGVTAPLAELSTDDGVTWRQVPSGAAARAMAGCAAH